MRQKRFITVFILVVFLVVLGLPSVIIYRERQQQRRNKALIAAIYRNDEQAVVTLLKAGADANALDGQPTPSVKQILLQWLDRFQGKQPRTLSNEKHSALWVAVKERYRSYWLGEGEPDNASIVQALLEHGANVKQRDENDWPLALYAISNRHTATLRVLLDYGANVNDKGLFGDDLIFDAVGVRRPDMARLLLSRGANPNAVHSLGKGAILFNCLSLYENEQTGCLLPLLEYGANPNPVDSDGMTPLMRCVWYGQPDNVRILIDHGANVNVRSHSGETALTIAEDLCRPALVKMLKQAGAKTGKELDAQAATPPQQ